MMKSPFTKLAGVSLWCLLLMAPNGFADTVYVWSEGSNEEPYGNTAGGSNHNLRLGSATITYSLSDPKPTGEGNLTGNPMFVGSGDYSLALGSPCIVQGLNQGWMVDALDLAGNRRRRGNVDIGAYENNAALGALLILLP